MAGFKREGRASVPHVYYCHVDRAEVSRKNVNAQTGELTYGASWGGQADVITRLLKAKQVVGADGQLQEITAARVNWHLLNVQDAIDFAIYAVRTTIDTMRFEARPKNVGGPIDVLLLTPPERAGFQRKELHGEPPQPQRWLDTACGGDMGLRLAARRPFLFWPRCASGRRLRRGPGWRRHASPYAGSSSSSAVAEQFLGLWQDGDYDAMYDLLASSSQAEISREKFVGRYQAIAEEATITGVSYIFDPAPDPAATELPFSVTFHTSFFGDILDVNNMTLVKEAQGWRVLWSPSLIFRDLDGAELVHFFPDFPRRGSIFDRHGTALALDGQLPVVGVVTGLIKDKEALIADLAQRLELPAEKVREKVEADLPSYYFIPLKTLPYGTPPEVLAPFEQIEGVVVRQETQRVYPEGSLAGHTLGYLAEVSEEQLKELGPKGYRPGDLIGAAGLEAHFQEELAGERGGTLAIITPEGTVSHTIAKREAAPGKDIHLALDVERPAGGRSGPRRPGGQHHRARPRRQQRPGHGQPSHHQPQRLRDRPQRRSLRQPGQRPATALLPPSRGCHLPVGLHLQAGDHGRRPGEGRLYDRLHLPLPAGLVRSGPGLRQEELADRRPRLSDPGRRAHGLLQPRVL